MTRVGALEARGGAEKSRGKEGTAGGVQEDLPPPLPTAAERPATAEQRRGAWGSLRMVLGSRGRLAGFLAGAAAVSFGYTVLLPFDYTQRLELANWGYLTPALGLWAVLLGSALSLVVSIQVHATRLVLAARPVAPSSGARTREEETSGVAAGSTGALAGAAAFVASLLPSFLCCTPIVPTLLAFVGVTGVGLYDTTGTLQHFFAVHQVEFLTGSLGLLVFTGWWGLRKVSTAACLDACCGPPALSRQAPRPSDTTGDPTVPTAATAGGHSEERR